MTVNHQETINSLRGIQSSLQQTADAARSHGDRVGGVFSSIGAGAVAMGNLIANAVTMGIGSLVGGVQQAVGTGMAFQGVLNRISAVSGATAQELDLISAKALQLGKDLPISAKDAADGMYAMATAGFTVNEVIASSTGVAQLASSQMMEVGRASEIVAATLRSFKIPADQASEAVDILSAAANGSALEVSDLGESIKYVGPIAGAAGQSLSDMAVALGLMANVGLKGSMAGTALRSTLTRLVAPPKEAAFWIEKLGIQVSDSSVQIGRSMKEIENDLKDWSKTSTKSMQEGDIAAAFNAIGAAAPRAKNGTIDVANSMKLLKGLLDNAEVSIEVKNAALAELGITYSKAGGKMLPFLSIVDQFREKFSGLSDAERQVAAKSIAGMEAMSGFLALVDASDADYQRMRQNIEAAQGAQDKFAQSMQKGLGFQMMQLQGSIETLLVQGFLLIEPALSSMAAGGVQAINTLIEGMTRLTDAAKIWKVAFQAGVDAGGGTGGGVAAMLASMGFSDDFAVKIGSWVTVFETTINDAKTRVQGAMSFLSDIGGDFQDGFSEGGLGGGVANLLARLGIDDNVAGLIGQGVEKAVGAIGAASQRLGQAISAFMSNPLEGVLMGGPVGIAILQALGLDDEVGAAIDQGVAVVEGGIQEAGRRISVAAGTFRTLTEAGATTGTIASGVLIALGLSEDIAGQVRVAVDTLERNIADARTRLSNAIDGFRNGIAAGPGVATINILTALGLSEEAAVRAGQIVGQIASAVSEGLSRARGALDAAMSGGGVEGVLKALGMSDETYTRLQGFAAKAGELLSMLAGRFREGWAGMVQAVGPLQPAMDKASEAVRTITSLLGPLAALLGGLVMGAFVALVGFVTGAMPGLGQAVRGAIDVAVGALELVAGVMQTTVEVIWRLINGDFAGAWEAAKNGFSNMAEGIKGILSGAWTVITGLVQAFIGGVLGAFDTLAQTLTGKTIPQLVDDAVKWFSDLPGKAADAVRNGIATVVGAAESLGQGVLDKLNSFVESVWDAGASLVTTFASGIRSKIEDALKPIAELAQRARDYLPGSDAKTGALSDLTDAGRALFETFAVGMELGQPAVMEQMAQAAETIRANLGTMVNLAGALEQAIAKTWRFGKSLGNEKEALADLQSAASSVAAFVKAAVDVNESLAKMKGKALGDDALAWTVSLGHWTKNVIDQLQPAARAVDEKILPLLATIATGAQSLSSLLSGAVGAFTALDRIVEAGGLSKGGDRFAWAVHLVHWAKNLIVELEPLANLFAEAKTGPLSNLTQQAQSFSSLLQSAVGAFLSLDAVVKAGGLSKGAERAQWAVDLFHWAKNVVVAIAQAVPVLAEELPTNLGRLGTSLSNLSGIINSVLGIAKTMEAAIKDGLGFLGSPQLRATILNAVAGIVLFARALSDAAQRAMTWRDANGRFISVVRIIVIPSLENLGTNLSNLSSVIGSVMSIARAFRDAAEGELVWSDQAIVDAIGRLIAFGRSLSDAAQRALTWRDANGRFISVVRVIVIPSLENLGSNLSNLSSVIGGVFGIVRAFAETVKDELVWDDATLQATIVDSADKLIRFGLALDAQARASLGLADMAEDAQAALLPAIPALGRLGTVVGDLGSVVDGVFGIVRSFAAIVKDQVDWRGTDTQSGILAALDNLIQFAVGMRNQAAASLGLADMAEEAQAALLPAIPALGRLGAVMGDLGNVADGVFGIVRSFAATAKDKLVWDDAGLQAAIVGSLNSLIRFGLALRAAAIVALGLTDLASEATQAALPAVPALGRLGTVIGDLGGVVDGVFSMVARFADAAKSKLVWDDAAVRTAVLDGIARIIPFALDMRRVARDAVAGLELEAIPALATLSSTLGDVLGIVSSGLDMADLEKRLRTFHGLNMATLAPKLDQLIKDLITVARDFGQKAASAGITEEWQKAASVLADVLGNAFGSMTDALGFFHTLFGDNSTLPAYIPTAAQVQSRIAVLLETAKATATTWINGLTAFTGDNALIAQEEATAITAVFEGMSSVVDAINKVTGLNIGQSGFGNMAYIVSFITQIVGDVAKAFSQGTAAAEAMISIIDLLENMGRVAGTTIGDGLIDGMAAAIRAGQAEVQAALSDVFGGAQGTGSGTGSQGRGGSGGTGSGNTIIIQQYVTAQMVMDPAATIVQIQALT